MTERPAAGSDCAYRPSADAIFAPQGPRAALTIIFPSAHLTHGSSPVLVPASGQAVGVVERRVADGTAAGDHVVHLDEPGRRNNNSPRSMRKSTSGSATVWFRWAAFQAVLSNIQARCARATQNSGA